MNARSEAMIAGAIRCAPETMVAAVVRSAPDDVLLAAMRSMGDEALYQWARSLPNVVLVDIASALVVQAVAQLTPTETMPAQEQLVEAANAAEAPAVDLPEAVVESDVLAYVRTVGTAGVASCAKSTGRPKERVESALERFAAKGVLVKDGRLFSVPPKAERASKPRRIVDHYDTTSARVHPAATRLPTAPPGRVGA